MLRIPKVLLLVESSRGSGRSLLRGIAQYVHHHGPWSFYWEPGGLEKIWPKLKSLDLDGIILRDVDKLEEVLAFGIPAVVIGHGRAEVPGLLNVITDSARIGLMAAEHLISCGFKKFAFCGGLGSPWEDDSWSELRRQSFAERLRQADYECETFKLPSSRHRTSWVRERAFMVRWLLSLPKPLGLLAANDDRASQVMEACKAAGISIPSEIGIIGVDNDDVVCGLSDPALSSVAVNFERAGYEAASALDSLMNRKGKVPARIVAHPTHIALRRSTDVVAVDDPALAKALRYIRNATSHQALTVALVARHAGLSRRLLEKRFRRELSCSVLDEIRRVHTDRMAQLLVETHLPVREIAERLGFGDVQHFARYFRAVKKVRPLAYRKAYAGYSAQADESQFGGSFTQSGVERYSAKCYLLNHDQPVPIRDAESPTPAGVLTL